MKNFNFLQIFGMTLEIFSFVGLIISLISDTSRGMLYLTFLVGILMFAIGNIVKRNKK